MLNKIDYKILSELDSNARESYSEIARTIGTSKQVVSTHVEYLLKEGHIKKFLTILDLSKMGLTLHKVYLRLLRASEKDELEIISFLKEHKNVTWLVRTEGIYDIAIAFHTLSINELNEILLELENKFGKFISEKVVNRVITGEFFHRDYLSDEKTTSRKKTIFQTYSVPFKFDDTDLKILAGLARDSRKSAVDISEKLKIGPDAVGKRIKILEKEGIIQNYILVLDSEKMEMLHYKVLMRVGNFTQEIEKKLLDFCKKNKNITFYNKGIGSWEIEIDLEVKNSVEFRSIMRDLKQKFADSIKEYFSLMVYEIAKFDFLPMHKF